jgi:DNA-binding XRE family transcriptional regulator
MSIGPAANRSGKSGGTLCRNDSRWKMTGSRVPERNGRRRKLLCRCLAICCIYRNWSQVVQRLVKKRVIGGLRDAPITILDSDKGLRIAYTAPRSKSPIKWTLRCNRYILWFLMKTTKNKSILPVSLRRAIARLGADISLARRKRSLTIVMMAERIGVHKNTYQKVERGDPSVAFGIYAMALFVLGLSDALTKVADPGRDDTGLLLDADNLPKRVRVPKEPQPL